MTRGTDGRALKEQSAKTAAERVALIAKMKRLRDDGLTFEAIAERLGMSTGRVSDMLKATRQ